MNLYSPTQIEDLVDQRLHNISIRFEEIGSNMFSIAPYAYTDVFISVNIDLLTSYSDNIIELLKHNSNNCKSINLSSRELAVYFTNLLYMKVINYQGETSLETQVVVPPLIRYIINTINRIFNSTYIFSPDTKVKIENIKEFPLKQVIEYNDMIFDKMTKQNIVIPTSWISNLLRIREKSSENPMIYTTYKNALMSVGIAYNRGVDILSFIILGLKTKQSYANKLIGYPKDYIDIINKSAYVIDYFPLSRPYSDSWRGRWEAEYRKEMMSNEKNNYY